MYSYKLESFKFHVGHFGLLKNNLSVNSERSYVCGCGFGCGSCVSRFDISFRREYCNNCIVFGLGNKFKTRIATVGYNMADSYNLKLKTINILVDSF